MIKLAPALVDGAAEAVDAAAYERVVGAAPDNLPGGWPQPQVPATLADALAVSGDTPAVRAADAEDRAAKARIAVEQAGHRPKLSLEAGTRIETSRISQSGGATKERGFTFVKPRFIAAYALRPTTQLRMRVERVVGQLDFEDFAASADNSTGVVSAGNANLEPERYWLAEAAFEQRFWPAVEELASLGQEAADTVEKQPPSCRLKDRRRAPFAQLADRSGRRVGGLAATHGRPG